jgi:hypothetical protein
MIVIMILREATEMATELREARRAARKILLRIPQELISFGVKQVVGWPFAL